MTKTLSKPNETNLLNISADEMTAMRQVASIEIIAVVISTNAVVLTSLRFHLQRFDLRDWPVIAAIQQAALRDNGGIVRWFLSPPTWCP